MIEPGAVTIAAELHGIAYALGNLAGAIILAAIIRAIFNK